MYRSSFTLRSLNLRKIVVIILSAIVSCYIGCKDNPVAPPIDTTHTDLNDIFSIYFLKDPTIKILITLKSIQQHG